MTFVEMRAVDPRTVDRRTLIQRNSVHVDGGAPQKDRCREFVEQIGNPYCYLDGQTVVKISFANTKRTFEDCIHGYLMGI